MLCEHRYTVDQGDIRSCTSCIAAWYIDDMPYNDKSFRACVDAIIADIEANITIRAAWKFYTEMLRNM